MCCFSLFCILWIYIPLSWFAALKWFQEIVMHIFSFNEKDQITQRLNLNIRALQIMFSVWLWFLVMLGYYSALIALNRLQNLVFVLLDLPDNQEWRSVFFSVSFLTVFAFCHFALHTVSNHEIAQTPYCPVHIKKELNLVTRSFFACVPTLQTHWLCSCFGIHCCLVQPLSVQTAH